MDSAPDIPETPDSDPWADVGPPSPSTKPKKTAPSVILIRVIAAVMFAFGALIVIPFSILLRLGTAEGILELPIFVSSWTLYGGIGICLLAFALYDRRWPFRFLKTRKVPR